MTGVELGAKWRDVIEDAGFEPGDLDTMRVELEKRRYLKTPADVLGDAGEAPQGGDNSADNGSSIALLAEYDGRGFC